MTYHLNFNLVLRYADRLWWGLGLSLELAFVSILIGCVIGFALAVSYTGGGRASPASSSRSMSSSSGMSRFCC